MPRERPKKCEHQGSFRATQGARDEGLGLCGVICMGCGAVQWPMADAWSDPISPNTTFSDGFRLDLLGDVSSDLAHAHRIARAGEQVTAIRYRDGGWFLHRGLTPPWWETKCDENNDLLYRVAPDFDEQAATRAIWDAALAPPLPPPIALAAPAFKAPAPKKPATAPVPCRRCGCVARLAVNASTECSACGQLVVRGVA